MRPGRRACTGLAAALAATGLALSSGCDNKGTGTTSTGSTPAVTSTSPAVAGTVTVIGSTTILEMSQKWAQDYRAKSGAVVTVEGGGSGVGITQLLAGQCDVANASRKMKSSEKEEALKKGKEAVEHVVALDAVTVIVHNSNPVTSLTMAQLKGIYTGAITRWSEISPGFSEDIVVFNRKSTSGTYETFKELVLHKDEFLKGALELEANAQVMNSIKPVRGGIGYVGLGYYLSAMGEVKGVPVEGVMPSASSVRAGTYKLSRELQCYTMGRPTGAVKGYIDYVMSAAGQRTVGDMGFVPVK